MSTTRNLFDDDPDFTALERSATRRAPAFGQSKKGQAVKRLLAQADSLREEFDRRKRRLDEALIVHAAQVEPRRQRVTELRTDVLHQLARFLEGKPLSKSDKAVLKTLMVEQLDEVLAHGQTPDADLAALFERLHGVSFDAAVQDDMDDVRADMEELFGELGIDMEVPDLRPGMTEEEVIAAAVKMREKAKAAQQAHAEREDARPRTKRQQREEQRAADRAARHAQARKISIGASYKRLVKVLHPDLEADPALREKKSAVMQEVTTAYRANDLPTLLRLELLWIEDAGADAARQTDEALTAYAEVLRAQAAQLREEIDALPWHPRYEPLVRPTEFGVFVGDAAESESEARHLDEVMGGLRAILGRLRDEGAAVAMVRELIAATRRARAGRRRR